MSVQFGRWNFDGESVDRAYVEKAEASIAPYGPDHTGSYLKGNISILYRAFHTTEESRRETQPHATSSGAILTWDGRLDNRTELIRRLGGVATVHFTDVEIVAAAYEYWGIDCFTMLIGDWALSIWNPRTRSLILAKDPIGTRHLYYSVGNDQVTWSTILDPLVLFAGKTLVLCEEYIAGWFSFFPAAHLTPYVGIHSVPPSSSVLLQPGRRVIRKYWDFDPAKRIRYRTDTEYEEHFRSVFGEAVRRRLRADRPLLAELSGGMDSSSIVCMADAIITGGAAEAPRLDTISYYDDSEPSWNERPYFTKVEEKRGRTGCHIQTGFQESFKFEFKNERLAVAPGSCRQSTQVSRQFSGCITSQRNRVVLSGIGGDEVMGGVPTPGPELANLLATARFTTLAHQLKVWALNKKTPWFHLFFEAARGFFPPALLGVVKQKRPAPWLNPDFVKRNRAALHGYETRLKFLGSLPSFQENLATLDALRRQLGCIALAAEPPYEKRYPYLDRGLLEFVYAIPREQLVRAGQRRSLMRRALKGFVPDEILQRRRKAFVVRGPLAGITAEWLNLTQFTEKMQTDLLGILDSKLFSDALQKARHGQEVAMVSLIRTLDIERWLRNLTARGILANHMPAGKGWRLSDIAHEGHSKA
jgi:asparagine synthase (glutamine-hydrolysing)